MSPLLTLILVNSTNMLTPTTATLKIQQIVNNYLAGVTSVALVTDDDALWDDLTFNMTSVRFHLDYYSPYHQMVQAYVVDFRQASSIETIVTQFKRNGETKFIFLVSDEVAMHGAREAELCHALIVMVTNISVTTKAAVERCKGIGVVPTSNALAGCETTASYLDFPPLAFIENSDIAGVEGLLAKTTAEFLGMRIGYVNRGESGWGTRVPPVGLEGDVDTGTSLVGISGIFPLVRRHVEFDMFQACVDLTIAWSVPAGAAHSYPSWFTALVTELTPSVWLGTLSVYLTVVIVAYITSEIKDEIPFQVLAMFIGTSHSQRRKVPKRLSGVVLIFGILICTTYTSTMSSKLTAPAPVADIKTIQELVKSGLQPQGPILPFQVMKQAVSDKPDLATLVKNYELTKASLDETFARMVTKRDNAFLRHAANIFYHAQKNPKTANKIHIVEEIVFPYRVGVLMKKHSCLFVKVKEVYNRLCEAGLSAKWTKDYAPHKQELGDGGQKPIDMIHLLGAFYLLLAGWALSSFGYVAERLWYWGSQSIAVRFGMSGDNKVIAVGPAYIH